MSRKQLEAILGDRAIADTEKLLAGNEGAIEFWSRFCSLSAPQLSAPQGFGTALREIRDAVIESLDRKAAAPLEVIPVSQRFLNASAVARALQAAAEEYNFATRSANATITAKKASLEGVSAEQSLRELRTLKATKARQGGECLRACTEYAEAVSSKERLEAKKSAAKKKLEEPQKL